jgi:hypothetical protein
VIRVLALALTLSGPAWSQSARWGDLTPEQRGDYWRYLTAPAPSAPDSNCPTYAVCSHPPWWPRVAPRQYTLDEIDRMRRAIAFLSDDADLMHPLSPSETEDRLRTYILAGITPEALEAKAGKKP